MEGSGRDDRRSLILDAVVRVIIEIGFTDMTVADVARTAGVSTALVHYHFSSKDELIVAALTEASEDDQIARDAIVRGGGSALSRIEQVLCGSLPDGPEDGSWLLWIETWGETRRNPSIRAVMRELDDHENSALAALIAEGEAAGELRCADADDAVARLTALRDGLVVEYTLFRPEEPIDLMVSRLRGAIRNNLGLPVDDLTRAR